VIQVAPAGVGHAILAAHGGVGVIAQRGHLRRAAGGAAWRGAPR
jgi:hypothetical protein